MEQQDAAGVGRAAPRPTSGHRGFRWWVRCILTWSALAVIGLIFLLFFEGSFGHDGLLCELGWVSEGGTTSGCGGFWSDEY